MNRIKESAVLAWGEYLGCCDAGRIDEALSLVGGLVVAVVGVWALCWLSSLAGAGTSMLGVPMLGVARVAWKRRGR